ncbi:MAG TPA: HEAT repeat domain-containing protein [Polyangiales bacterium]|nr:HEAT repeat domain-containing protein [Polyangiales bacterium]
MRIATSISAETVQLQGGASVGLVRLSAAPQSSAVLIAKRGTKLESLWVGRLDFTGDPGERRADVIEISDRDADGHPDIVVGQYDENVAVCGQEHTLLSPRAIDPKTLTLRSVLLNRYSHRPIGLQLSAAASAPSSLKPPALLRALRPSAASSSAAAPHDVSALADADLHTYWEEGRGLGGRFEFATFQWSAPARPIVALAIVPVPEGAATATTRANIRSLSVLGPNQERWSVTLPDQLKPGERYWFAPPQPVSWRCLTLGVDELRTETQLTPQTHASLAELEAYTDLDVSGGFAQLVQELAQPGVQGDDATALLQRAQGDVPGALASAWPGLPRIGKLRVLRLLFQNPTTADPRAEGVLRSALRDADAEVMSTAIKLAMGKAPFGYALLTELAHSATQQGDVAVQNIGHSKRADALEMLLTILAEPGASERPALREAIAAAYPHAHAETLAGWTGNEGSTKPRDARASLALALSTLPAARPLAAKIVEELSGDAKEFPEQWRLVQAARNLPSEPRGDGYLETLAQRAETWMLRSAAVEALAQRNAPSTQSVAQRALDDEYPRVRASAVGVLAKLPATFEMLSQKVLKDHWFLVRRTALDELPDSPDSRRWFVTELSDPIAIVRASAIRALARVGASESWSKIEPALQNPEEYPEVIAEAVSFSRALCVRAAIPGLRQVVTRGLKPDAWSVDQELALSALETLSAFGGADAEWAKSQASSSLVPKEVQLAAAAALKRAPACSQKGPSL